MRSFAGMRTIICGSRTLDSYELVEAAVKASGFTITEVVSGCGKGIDLVGEKWAENNWFPVKRFPAKWDEQGKAAGPLRNRDMITYVQGVPNEPGQVIAVWDGVSRGTEDCFSEARRRGCKVFVYRIAED